MKKNLLPLLMLCPAVAFAADQVRMTSLIIVIVGSLLLTIGCTLPFGFVCGLLFKIVGLRKPIAFGCSALLLSASFVLLAHIVYGPDLHRMTHIAPALYGFAGCCALLYPFFLLGWHVGDVLRNRRHTMPAA